MAGLRGIRPFTTTTPDIPDWLTQTQLVDIGTGGAIPYQASHAPDPGCSQHIWNGTEAAAGTTILGTPAAGQNRYLYGFDVAFLPTASPGWTLWALTDAGSNRLVTLAGVATTTAGAFASWEAGYPYQTNGLINLRVIYPTSGTPGGPVDISVRHSVG